MTDRELMQMALNALEKISMGGDPRWAEDVMPALRARLAQPEPEPLWIRNQEGKLELHTPPQREWQGLTDEERTQIWDGIIKYIAGEIRINDFAKAIEAKLKEKNG